MTEQATITSSAGMLAIPAIQDMATAYRMNVEAFAFTFRAVAMPHPHSEAEFVSCCLVAQQHGLNPLTKEIYFMRTRSNGIQAIVSVDGWIKKANDHPQFDGIEFENLLDDDGNLISMTAVIYRKDRSHPIKVTEWLDECKAAGGPIWKTSPKRMLRNRTICQGCRIAFGFAGIMDRDEFDQWQRLDGDSPRDITPAPASEPMSQDIPEMPDPVAASDDIPEMPDPESQAEPEAPAIDVADFLLTLLAEVKKVKKAKKDKAAILALWDKHAETLEKLSDEDRDRAEKILEGRAK